jgi:hypothetical protein
MWALHLIVPFCQLFPGGFVNAGWRPKLGNQASQSALGKEKKQKKKRVHLGVTKTSPTEEKVTHVG